MVVALTRKMKYKIVILLLAVLLTGCKAKKVVEQRRSTDSIHMQSIEAMSVGGLTREQNSERIVVVSIMELDTTTGAMRETRRTTTTERTTSNEVEKTENQAQNNVVETFSGESEVLNSQTTESGSNGVKTGFKLGWWAALVAIAAIVAVAVFLRLKYKNIKIFRL